jgi:hypothetical protein
MSFLRLADAVYSGDASHEQHTTISNAQIVIETTSYVNVSTLLTQDVAAQSE